MAGWRQLNIFFTLKYYSTMPYKTFPLGDEHVVRIEYRFRRLHIDREVVRRLCDFPDEAKTLAFEPQETEPVIMNVTIFGPPKDTFTFFELQTIMEEAQRVEPRTYTAEEVGDAHFDEAFQPC